MLGKSPSLKITKESLLCMMILPLVLNKKSNKFVLHFRIEKNQNIRVAWLAFL